MFRYFFIILVLIFSVNAFAQAIAVKPEIELSDSNSYFPTLSIGITDSTSSYVWQYSEDGISWNNINDSEKKSSININRKGFYRVEIMLNDSANVLHTDAKNLDLRAFTFINRTWYRCSLQ